MRDGWHEHSQTVTFLLYATGKTPEEIRRTFNIKNDFTPEEEEQVSTGCTGLGVDDIMCACVHIDQLVLDCKLCLRPPKSIMVTPILFAFAVQLG